MTHKDMLLREAHSEDLRELERLERWCFEDPWSFGQLEGQLRNSSCRCALLQGPRGQILGYCFYGTTADICEIHSIAVRPGWRRQGIGAMLVEHVLSRVRGRVRQVWLDVRRGNTAARALYARCGFEETGARRAYYGNGEDAVLMTRHMTKR